eukprot:6487105-Amphidinium_carterae.1
MKGLSGSFLGSIWPVRRRSSVLTTAFCEQMRQIDFKCVLAELQLRRGQWEEERGGQRRAEQA